MEYSISHVRLGECQKIEGIKIQILKIEFENSLPRKIIVWKIQSEEN